MQSLNKQNVNNLQHKISRDYPKNEAGGFKGKTAWRPSGTIRIDSTQIRWFFLQSCREAGPC
jgi:hypothetical protein